MQKITSISELKNAIQLMEIEQVENGRLLKEQLHATFESFKPVNIIANALKNIEKSPYLIENVLGAAMGLLSGFYSNRLIFNPQGNKLKKLFGVVLQFGVTNLVAKHQGIIRSLGQVLIKRIARKKRMNSIKP